MDVEKFGGGSSNLEIADANLNRLKLLLGEDFNDTEMEDYLSYIDPKEASKMIDEFASKLEAGKQDRTTLINNFKGYLGFKAA